MSAPYPVGARVRAAVYAPLAPVNAEPTPGPIGGEVLRVIPQGNAHRWAYRIRWDNGAEGISQRPAVMLEPSDVS